MEAATIFGAVIGIVLGLILGVIFAAVIALVVAPLFLLALRLGDDHEDYAFEEAYKAAFMAILVTAVVRLILRTPVALLGNDTLVLAVIPVTFTAGFLIHTVVVRKALEQTWGIALFAAGMAYAFYTILMIATIVAMFMLSGATRGA